MNSHLPRILFVCTGNAGRSQMAAALFTAAAGGRAAVDSAGVAPWPAVHPVAARLMLERGLDIRANRPKPVAAVSGARHDVVVTLGDKARDLTPELPGNPCRLHWAVSDPADADGTDRQEPAFRYALADIERRLPDLLALIGQAPRASALHLKPGLSTCFTRPNLRDRNAFHPATHIPLLARAGFACIELNAYLGSQDFPWDRPDAVKDLAAVATDHGVAIYSVHAPGELYSPDPRRRRLMLDLARATADVAVLLNAAVVPIHAGLPPGIERARGEAILREVLGELVAHALPLPCVFGWENEAPGLSAGEHLAWIREFNPGGLGLVFDSGHANLDGSTDAYLAGAGRRLMGLHLDDNDGRGGEDDHRLPGRGTFPWSTLVPRLNQAGYTGPLMLEVQAFDRQHDLPGLLADAARAVASIHADPSS